MLREADAPEQCDATAPDECCALSASERAPGRSMFRMRTARTGRSGEPQGRTSRQSSRRRSRRPGPSVCAERTHDDVGSRPPPLPQGGGTISPSRSPRTRPSLSRLPRSRKAGGRDVMLHARSDGGGRIRDRPSSRGAALLGLFAFNIVYPSCSPTRREGAGCSERVRRHAGPLTLVATKRCWGSSEATRRRSSLCCRRCRVRSADSFDTLVPSGDGTERVCANGGVLLSKDRRSTR
mmetsp:Transcript_26610/g.78686  ORF Transcript_26610/g.78686 Transcript_26610/m.78686 type:complete len:237 (-) Transcript_26610:95-805(-)